SSSERTSHGAATTPSSPRSSPLREASPRLTPRSCSIRATAAPIPRLAPVITAVFPSSAIHPPVVESATENTQYDRRVLTRAEVDDARHRAAAVLDAAGIVLTPEEREGIEIADFGLSRLAELGLEVVVYMNTDRVCAKELVLFPRQTC